MLYCLFEAIKKGQKTVKKRILFCLKEKNKELRLYLIKIKKILYKLNPNNAYKVLDQNS